MTQPFEDIRERVYGRGYMWSKQERAQDAVRLLSAVDALMEVGRYAIQRYGIDGDELDYFLAPLPPELKEALK